MNPDIQTALIIYLMILPLLRASYDAVIIEIKEKSINYLKHNIMTFIAGVVFLVSWWGMQGHTGVWLACKLVILQLAVYTLTFDYLLNWMREKKPILAYYGDPKDKINQSFLEKHVLQKYDWKIILVGKIVFFILAFIIY